MNDGDHYTPPEIRTDALNIPVLTSRGLNNGERSQAGAMFDLADDIEGQVTDMIDYLERIRRTLTKRV